MLALCEGLTLVPSTRKTESETLGETSQVISVPIS